VKVKTKDGEQVIDLLRPKYIEDANPQAIFIDEFNRSHKKVRNAVMELIQFKTINGQKISKDLKVVWAAINPEDSEYDTDRLDPAQRDRFHIHVHMPYQCDRTYFTQKFGSKVASAAIEYWNNIPEELRNQVSPRRLDYALTVLQDGGDARDVLPVESNVSALTLALKSGPIVSTLEKFLSTVDDGKVNKEAINFFKDETNYARSVSTIVKDKKYFPLVGFFPKEKMAVVVAKIGKLRAYVKRDIKVDPDNSPFLDPLKEIVAANQNRALSNKLVGIIPKSKVKPQKKWHKGIVSSDASSSDTSSAASSAASSSGSARGKYKQPLAMPSGKIGPIIVAALQKHKHGLTGKELLKEIVLFAPTFDKNDFSSKIDFVRRWGQRNGIVLDYSGGKFKLL
jgi:hypothetical protein